MPFTLQTQNVVTAVLSELLSTVQVWQLQCLGVNQTSPEPGSSNSTALLTYVLQQEATALYVGQVNRPSYRVKFFCLFSTSSLHFTGSIASVSLQLLAPHPS